MGRIYESLRDAGVVTLDVNLLRGTPEDQSIYRNEVTVNGTPRWTRGQQGWGTAGQRTIQIANNVAIQSPKTLIFYSEKPIKSGVRLISKWDGVGTDIDLFDNGNVSLFDGSTVRQVLASRGRLCIINTAGIAVSDTNSGTFTSLDAKGIASAVFIGGTFSAAVQFYHTRPIYRAMLLNQALSQTAVQDLLAELLAERYPTKAYFFQQETITKQIGTPALHWDLKERDASGQFPDLSGNGRLTTTVRTTYTSGGQKCSGDSAYVEGAPLGPTVQGLNSHAISVWAKPSSFIGGSDVVVSCAANYYITLKNVQQTIGFNSGSEVQFTCRLLPNVKYHIVAVKESSNSSSVYANGKKLAYLLGTTVTTPTPLANGYIGRYVNTGNSSRIIASNLRSFQTSNVDIRQLYLEGSRVASCTKVDLLPVSLANMTTANMQLEDTPWRLVSGQWSVVTGKAINCVAAGALYEKCEEIGGTITTSIVWSSGTMAIGWTTVKGNATATGQNAYWARIDSNTIRITKSVAGVETTLASGGTIVAGKQYQLHFTWEFDGALQVYYREIGGSWVLATTATDTAVTTNTFCCLYSTAASNQWKGDIARNEIALLPHEFSML